MKENEIEEGKVKKGRVNSKPTSSPPEPPKGQGGKSFSIPPKWPDNELISEFDTSIPDDIQIHLDVENSNLIPDDERIILDDFSHWPKNDGWPRNEEILRELLWMEHQCEGKYGDDGEMQCGKCLIDFRRDSAKDIAIKTQKRNDERMRNWHKNNG